MIENHSKDRLVKEVLMMVFVMHIEEDDTVLHIKKTGMLMLVVEIDVDGMTVVEVDKLNCSSDDVQPKQVDLRYAHALTELHWHDIHVDPDRHEVDQQYFFNRVTPFSSIVGQRSGPLSTDSRIIRPCCRFNIYSSIRLFHEPYISFSSIGGRAARRRKGVVIRDPKESATPSTFIHTEAKSKDNGKGIMEKEDNVVKRYQALKRKPQTEVQARKNVMIYLRNVAGFKMDYFKGMTYDDIRPIFKKKFNSNVAFLQKTKEQMDEEDSRALKRLSERQ
nr:hypothetical protein [Tanacetum cinerariifolium]